MYGAIHKNSHVSNAQLSLDLSVGDRVIILDDIDTDDDGGLAGTIVFDDRIEQLIPDSGKLVFESSDMGWADFNKLLDTGDYQTIQIVRPDS